MSPKDVRFLTPEPVAMLPYMAKGFTDVVKLGSWDRESIWSYLHRTRSSQGSLGEGAWKVRVREGDMVTEAEIDPGSLQGLEKASQGIVPLQPPGEPQPPACFRLLTSRAVK